MVRSAEGTGEHDGVRGRVGHPDITLMTARACCTAKRCSSFPAVRLTAAGEAAAGSTIVSAALHTLMEMT